MQIPLWGEWVRPASTMRESENHPRGTIRINREALPPFLPLQCTLPHPTESPHQSRMIILHWYFSKGLKINNGNIFISKALFLSKFELLKLNLVQSLKIVILHLSLVQYKLTKLTPGDVLGERHKTRCEEGTKCPIIATLHIVQPHHMQRVNERERNC